MPAGRSSRRRCDPAWTAADLSDREHFKIHAANPQVGLYIGVPVLARGSHRVKIPMSIRFDQPDGTFGGTLFATVAPEFLTLLYDSVNLGQTGSVIVAGTDGAVRAYLSRHRDAGAGEATAREDGSADGSEFQHFALPRWNRMAPTKAPPMRTESGASTIGARSKVIP